VDDKTYKTCEELMLELARGNRSAFTETFDTPIETAPGCASDVLRTRDELRVNDVAPGSLIGIIRTARNDSKERGARFETWFRMVVIRRVLTMGRDEARRNVRRLAPDDEPAAREFMGEWPESVMTPHTAHTAIASVSKHSLMSVGPAVTKTRAVEGSVRNSRTLSFVRITSGGD
jgi:hypothetical protein